MGSSGAQQEGAAQAKRPQKAEEGDPTHQTGTSGAGREPGSLCLPLATPMAGALGSLRVVPVRGPAMGLSLASPSGVGLGLRALRWLACVRPGH